MGRAGGRGGGGRSGGSSGGSRGGSFGGSRGGSFGGGGYSSRSSSSGRSYSSTSSRSRSSGSYGHSGYGTFWGTPRTSGPVIINNSGNRNYSSPGNNSSGNNPNNVNKPQNNNGCIHVFLITAMIISLVAFLFFSIVSVSAKSDNREKLVADVNVTGYYTDELGWINNSATLTEGMKYFFEKTGVQPYLYITDDVGGSFYDYAEEFANNKYDELFTDEAHLLLIFHEKNDWYDTYCLAGSSADTVIDSEARMILLDTLDEYYYDSSLDDNEYFSKSFKDSADEIMKEQDAYLVFPVIWLIIFVAALGLEITMLKKEKEEKRKKELKEIFEKPLETFGSTEAAELAKKYENNESTETKASDEAATVVDKCIKCNNVLEENSNFCSSCGEKIVK